MEKKLRNLCAGVIVFTVLVILWGAYVRATGAGAGCGSHWPLCNGQVLPQTPSEQTVIEFTHRLTSGLSLILVLWVSIWTVRSQKTSSNLKKAGWIAGISILLEALIGAGLVLFELVSHDKSLKRTISISLHFCNTLVLLASLTWIAAGVDHVRKKWAWPNPKFKRQASSYLLLFFFLGMAGAITALGDSLFPSETLAQGIQRDFLETSHFLIRLRVIHPIIAVLFATFFTPWVYDVGKKQMSRSFLLIGLVFTNLVLGLCNLIWLAPVPLQMFHLFVALCLWICFILFLEKACRA